jgi:GDPmannose 4,6-dehydratase
MQWMMLQQNHPEDFVIATGIQYSVRQFIECSAAELGMQLRWEGVGVSEVGYWQNPPRNFIATEARKTITSGLPIVRIDPAYFRPTEVETLLGDATKARQKLGWVPEISMQEMCAEMITNDLAQAKQRVLLKNNGF